MKWGIPQITFRDGRTGAPVLASVFGTLDPVQAEHEEAWKLWLADAVKAAAASYGGDVDALAARPADLTAVLVQALGPTLVAQLGPQATIAVVGVRLGR